MSHFFYKKKESLEGMENSYDVEVKQKMWINNLRVWCSKFEIFLNLKIILSIMPRTLVLEWDRKHYDMVVGGCTTASHTEVEAVLEWSALILSIVRVKKQHFCGFVL